MTGKLSPTSVYVSLLPVVEACVVVAGIRVGPVVRVGYPQGKKPIQVAI